MGAGEEGGGAAGRRVEARPASALTHFPSLPNPPGLPAPPSSSPCSALCHDLLPCPHPPNPTPHTAHYPSPAAHSPPQTECPAASQPKQWAPHPLPLPPPLSQPMSQPTIALVPLPLPLPATLEWDWGVGLWERRRHHQLALPSRPDLQVGSSEVEQCAKDRPAQKKREGSLPGLSSS